VDRHQVDYWDRVADAKTFSHPLDDELLELAPRTARVLDLGCGYGRTLAQLHERGYRHLSGVDTSGAMIARGRRLFPHLDLRVAGEAPERETRADGAFDLVLLFSVLTSTPGDDAQRRLIAAAGRRLAPEGLLYVSDLWLQEDERNRARYRAGLARHGRRGVFDLPEGGTFRHHDRAWVEELLRPFERLALRDIQVSTMNGHPARGFQFLGRSSKPSATPA
jgi:SAM-dependent methyltransferase